jgi:IS4 transposase
MISQARAFFVTRAKSNLKFRRVYSHQTDRQTGVICDQSIMLTSFYPAKNYPEKLRRVKYYDAENDKTLVFLTNNFTLPAKTIADLYRCRWQVELFFKWIKQNLRIKTFYGTSENAVKVQIWTAVSAYLLVAIMKKRLKIKASLYTILQVLSVTIFEKMSILQAVEETEYTTDKGANSKQLFLFK